MKDNSLRFRLEDEKQEKQAEINIS